MLERILDLLYPPRCVFCGKLLGEREEEFCRACGEQLPMATGEKTIRMLPGGIPCVAPLYYRTPVRESLRAYKFHDKRWRGAHYGRLIAPFVREQNWSVDLVTWVPLSRAHKRKRGYDQAALVASALAADLSLPCQSCLAKTRDTKQQSRLRFPEERRANVLNAYAPGKGMDLHGRSILLVDDIVTSGSTMEECARVLLFNGARAVFCAAVAQSAPKTGNEWQDSCKSEKESI